MEKKQLLINIAESFFMTWGLSAVCGLAPGNIITLVIFAFCFLLVAKTTGCCKKTADRTEDAASCGPAYKKTSVILSILYTVFYVSAGSDTILKELSNPLFRLVVLCAVSVGLFFLFYRIVLLLFSFFLRERESCGGKKTDIPGDYTASAKQESGGPQEADGGSESGGPQKANGVSESAASKNRLAGFYVNHTFLSTFILCLVGYLPYFLYLYPGVMTPDSVIQLGQVLGTEVLSNHHPVAHTFFIGICYRIGFAITKDRTAAVSFYSIFQLLFMSFCASFAVSVMKKLRIRPLWCFLATCFYALVPYHGVFSVTMWKDIPFAGIITLFVCALLTENVPLLFLSGLGAFLFRSNGWYAMLLFLPVYVIFQFRKKKDEKQKKLFGIPACAIAFLTSFIIALVIKYPVYHLMGVESPDFVESLSIPLQQTAAVIAYNGDLTDYERAEIEKVINTAHVKRLYEPTFADNIKELVRAGHPEYLEANKGRFLLIWASVGLRNPVAYFRAFVRQTAGYYYPDEFYTVADAEGIAGSAYGITHSPRIGGPVVIKAKEILIKLGNMIPLYSILWCMGAVFWIMLFFMGLCVVKGKKERLIFYLPCLFLLLTVLIATPVAAEFRYVYFLVFALPLYPVIALYGSEENRL